MLGYMVGFNLAVAAWAQQEEQYQKACEAAKAAGIDPPTREQYFGPSIKYEPPKQPEKCDCTGSLALGVFLGTLF